MSLKFKLIVIGLTHVGVRNFIQVIEKVKLRGEHFGIEARAQKMNSSVFSLFNQQARTRTDRLKIIPFS
jgi:hypothetical protein